MQWNITTDRPVYLQLIETLELAIITGEYQPGGKLPSVRELAEQAAVNPNTMQKALSEMEAKGLVTTQRTTGRTITEDTNMLTQIKTDLAKQTVAEFLASMKSLGFTKQDIIKLIENNEEA